MSIKTVNISNKYQENIQSIEAEETKVQEVVQNIYARFMSEQNANHVHYALQALREYRYVPNKYCIPMGHYIRYIVTTAHLDMKLKVGGFVMSDNGFSVTFKSSANNMLIKLSKRHCIMFVMITHNEKLRCALSKVDKC